MTDLLNESAGFLSGVRVIEIANELGEYAGRLLAGLGADVIKVEPPGGSSTRRIGPFLDDVPHPDRSLHFWHYNLGKRSVVLDLDDPADQERLRGLISAADVLLETTPRRYLADRGLGAEQLRSADPSLVVARITPFGDDGPWADFAASDLIHLAMGGVVMNCGYDADPDGVYRTPPIAPQMWQAYQITGELLVISLVSALTYRLSTGAGQVLTTSVHESVSKNTESDLPDWVYQRQQHFRQTCRHSLPNKNASTLARTKDDRWVLPYGTYLSVGNDSFESVVRLLDRYGLAGELTGEAYSDPVLRRAPATQEKVATQIKAMFAAHPYDRDIWREAQEFGMPWAPIRRPEEHLDDEHWAERRTFSEVYHPELDRSFTYVTAKWVCEQVPWSRGPRPPLLGEHTEEVLGALPATAPSAAVAPTDQEAGKAEPMFSRHGKPFALPGVRVVDLAWLLASGGAGRFFSAQGADVIKVEHSSRWDGMRFGTAFPPLGGRAERDASDKPFPTPAKKDPNGSGLFMEINAGKLGMSLNLKKPEGKALLRQLLAEADVVIEGFSPGTMKRMGFGYEQLKEINPRIIYVQQSGMGELGRYQSIRSYGPTAQALSGLSDMSGLADPAPPAGIGYSYLDWFGAYNMATAMMAALYRQRRTGEGCYIDCSQVETGIYLTGTATLDYSANGRHWHRYGNQSPYQPAAPHGAFPCAGEDRWIAVACFDDEQWSRLAKALGHAEWLDGPRFATLSDRIDHQDELERCIGAATADFDRYELMLQLQAAGVPAGVCQTAEDRCDRDPQLRHLKWMVELDQTRIGRWPVKELSVHLSETPSYIGGWVDRSGPNYGEDTNFVLAEFLKMSVPEIAELHREDTV